jgi:thiopurine S-methyltransferase
MEHQFWHEKWKRKEIGFHEGQPNSLLVRFFSRLGLTEGQRIFLPLCGKTHDIHWFLERGLRVAGAELNEAAVKELFDDLGLTPQIECLGKLQRYSAESIDIFLGDIFELTSETLGPVDAVYDRAAMVALPESVRFEYTTHLRELAPGSPILLIVFEYEQSQMAGPPFCITANEVERSFGQTHNMVVLESEEVEGKLKGQVVAQEIIRLCVEAP